MFAPHTATAQQHRVSSSRKCVVLTGIKSPARDCQCLTLLFNPSKHHMIYWEWSSERVTEVFEETSQCEDKWGIDNTAIERRCLLLKDKPELSFSRVFRKLFHKIVKVFRFYTNISKCRIGGVPQYQMLWDPLLKYWKDLRLDTAQLFFLNKYFFKHYK